MPTYMIDTASKAYADGLIRNHWKPTAVAKKIHCHPNTVYTWEKRIQMFGTMDPPKPLRRGRRQHIHTAAKNAMLEYQRQYPWIYQDELAAFLEEEWSLAVSRSTISRLLKKERMSRKKGQRIGHTQSLPLRNEWQAFMCDVTAEQLVFIDESIFKVQTGWRCMAYGPIGEASRWRDDMDRGTTWSILPAYTIDGYLPITAIKEGFFHGDTFLAWITNELLPHCNPFPGPRSVICLDNLNLHLNRQVRAVVESKGVLLKFLPPYSPDYSPIELTFSVLKAWMRRHFNSLRDRFRGDFGGFLRYAIEHSQCDQYAIQHFHHCAGGYKFQGDLQAFQRELAAYAFSNDLGESDS